ncbi:P-loop containing nucleoside triphosphate hydrolase protein [Fimicolochytrium jonesii]|uniref:P-loop containing nucleoside triphosphate hydrolase protein n=1 Tax=Fimicolochytrium jonesii TaxID=1396493 RepID=UPI0022FE519E|nr:P-loop containing nucleoside triphosphate hydrolase protein [Fimicolochytrium jonesii]KAI8815568.1 P-loop containing nucleoside triphosphate hydrolase protein [Fimicolochytrium jonesii]
MCAKAFPPPSDFFDTVLAFPFPQIAYATSKRISTLLKTRVIEPNPDELFDYEAFAAAGKCIIEPAQDVYSYERCSYPQPEWSEDEPWRRNDNADDDSHKYRAAAAGNAVTTQVIGWNTVDWNDEHLTLVVLNLTDSFSNDTKHVFIAAKNGVAERFLLAVTDFSRNMTDRIWSFQDGRFTADRRLYTDIQTSTFDNLILANNMAAEIKSDLELFFASSQLYKRLNIPWKRGVLLTGPPGNGKTHLIKALVNHFKQQHPTIAILYIKTFTASCAPDDYAIRTVFKRARARPCIVIFEDLDALVKPDVRSAFLNELDGLSANNGVVVVASTNHPEELDSAIRDRPSRFDRRWAFELPGEVERLSYLKKWFSAREFDTPPSDEAMKEVAGALTAGFSFAYLKELALGTTLQSVRLEGGDGGEAGKQGAMDKLLMEQAGVLGMHVKKAREEDAGGSGEGKSGWRGKKWRKHVAGR